MRLRRILTNLAGNAIDCTDRGTVMVRAELLAREWPQMRVRFEVNDTDVGIGPKQRDGTVTGLIP